MSLFYISKGQYEEGFITDNPFYSTVLTEEEAQSYPDKERSLMTLVSDKIDDIYVPGNFKCAKCGCGLVTQTLYTQSGNVGANNAPQRCPNDCGPMWRVTWKERAEQLYKDLLEARGIGPEDLHCETRESAARNPS